MVLEVVEEVVAIHDNNSHFMCPPKPSVPLNGIRISRATQVTKTTLTITQRKRIKCRHTLNGADTMVNHKDSQPSSIS